MPLDETTKRQLADARENILGQLDRLEFRIDYFGAGWHRRGPQDRGDAYDELVKELREINQLLGLDADDGL